MAPACSRDQQHTTHTWKLLRSEWPNLIKHINDVLQPRPGEEKGSREQYMTAPVAWSGKSATLQNQSLCQHSRWLLAQGRRHRRCRAGCRAALGGRRWTDGRLLVYFCNCHCSKHNQRRNGIFERISVLKKVEAHTKKTVKKKQKKKHMCSSFPKLKFALLCSTAHRRLLCEANRWCLCQSHPHSTRPGKQS